MNENEIKLNTDHKIAVVVKGEVTHVLGVEESLYAALLSSPSFFSIDDVDEEILPGFYYDRFNQDVI